MFSSLFNNPLVTVKSTNHNWYICHLHVPLFFQIPDKVEVLIFRSFSFILWSAGTAKSKILLVLFFFFLLLIILRSGLLAEIRWSVCISKSHRSLCESFSRTSACLCIYHLFVRSNLNFLHISPWITLPNQLCLVFYTFCANLLHSLIMWLIVSSLSSYDLHLLFCYVLSILALLSLLLLLLALLLPLLLYPKRVIFTPALANRLSLDSEWQEVNSGLPDTSHNSCRLKTVVWRVSILPPVSKSSSPLSMHFEIVTISTPNVQKIFLLFSDTVQEFAHIFVFFFHFNLKSTWWHFFFLLINI